jgi:hypothetical protein
MVANRGPFDERTYTCLDPRRPRAVRCRNTTWSLFKAWRVWVGKPRDVYIACRDNFKEAKVSLHASGRWRMAFTEEAVTKNRKLLWEDGKRTWDVWDEPPPSLPGVVTAFHLVFPTSEHGVHPEQRPKRQWDGVVFISEAPPDLMMLVTLFLTIGDPFPRPRGAPARFHGRNVGTTMRILISARLPSMLVQMSRVVPMDLVSTEGSRRTNQPN